MEWEDEEASKEYSKSHSADNDHLISPAHIAGGGAAIHPITNSAASRQGYIAPVLGGSAIGNGRGSNNANWLPQAQQGHKCTALLRQELEGNGSVDGDVTAEADGREEV